MEPVKFERFSCRFDCRVLCTACQSHAARTARRTYRFATIQNVTDIRQTSDRRHSVPKAARRDR